MYFADSEYGKVDEHDCVAWSPNQEWMFKSIKIQPYFPSKEQLVKNPIKPDEQLPFDAQSEVFFPNAMPHPPKPKPGQPLYVQPRPLATEEEKKADDEESDEEDDDEPNLNVPHTRPNPIVLNPKEAFPPVQPKPIFPKGTVFLPPIGKDGKPDYSKPPVPQVRHPGLLPYPRKPVVTDPKKPIWPPTLFGSFGPTPPTTAASVTPQPKASEEDQEEESREDDDKEEKEEDDREDKEEDDRDEKEERDQDRAGTEEDEDEVSRERDDISGEGDEEE